ncbi:MAG: peptidylprolyl isomerase [Gemmatimonadota bacterium]|jgi:peptidyl-prolyl cis-trans isomerase SurA
MRINAIAALLIAGTTAAVHAQETTPRTVRLDGIVAVVGDSVITDLDMAESFQLWQSQQPQRPAIPQEGTPEYDQLYQSLLQDRVTTLLLLQAALRDTTIHVTSDDIEQAVQQQIDTVQSQFADPTQFEAALRNENLTLDSYRENLRAQLRRTMLAGAYLNQVRRDRKPPPVTDAEIRALFEQEAGQIPMIPPSIVFEQVVIPIIASDSARATARAKADSILTAIRDGADFADMAKRFSEDGSAAYGGELGWFRLGQMVPEFERAAYALKAGELSEPVESPFGFHIIKLERIRGPERSASHILIRPVLTSADSARTEARATEAADRWRAGTPLDSLRRLYGDRDELARVGPNPRDSLPEGYKEALSDVTEGQIVGPFLVGAGGPSPKFVVARVRELSEQRPATVDDYRPTIENIIANRKLNEEIIAELRRRTRVEIRKPAGGPNR